MNNLNKQGLKKLEHIDDELSDMSYDCRRGLYDADSSQIDAAQTCVENAMSGLRKLMDDEEWSDLNDL